MNDLVISKLDSANRALSEAKTIQDTKKILDIAVAAKIYAQRQKLGEEAINYANSIKIEALRRLGQMLKETPRNKGGKPVPHGYRLDNPPTIPQMGIDRKISVLSQQIATLEPEQFEQVKSGHVAMAKAIRESRISAKRSEKIKSISDPTNLESVGKFSVLYCDPPWEYEHSISKSRDIENQYPTMSLEKICALPIHDISQPDSVLFMWATSPKLLEAMSVISAWGFEYRTCAVWDKEIIGMGYYFRQQHELLLVSVRGNLPLPLPAHRPSSVIKEKRGKHSAKPEIVYKILETMYPDFPKIELFSRLKREGWSSWGNEIPK